MKNKDKRTLLGAVSKNTACKVMGVDVLPLGNNLWSLKDGHNETTLKIDRCMTLSKVISLVETTLYEAC